eukprot:TRINITY_DN1218_c0_g2_i1.p1 TRINITY_DN1218_c0_g2~~TRINITY_DN1218_c0_g2_i1.p1  ORF type:complete len:1011 (+),score=241.30 TRINITY_DN1218_c0_g2_i1:393-3425(+)
MKDREGIHRQLFEELRAMGFSEKQCLRAARKWTNLQVAIEWIIENEGNESPPDSPEEDALALSNSPGNSPGSSPVEMTAFSHPDAARVRETNKVETPIADSPDIDQLPPLVSPRRITLSSQRQIVESYYNQQPTGHFDEPDRTIPSASPMEDDLSLAIEKSLQDASKDNSTQEDPYSRIRNGSMPVGLKNIGNTCYANSLLQTYFMLPEFRELILSLPFTLNVPVDESHPCRLIHELQKLFAFMWDSKRKYVIPTHVIRSLLSRTDATKNMIKRIGTQEDPTEFNMIFIERMKEGLAQILSSEKDKIKRSDDALETVLLHEEKENIPDDPTTEKGLISKDAALSIVQRLFFGDLVDVVTTSEADGTPVEIKKTEEFFQIILDIKSGDLYQSLDEYTSGEKIADYTTEKGFVTQADRVVRFKRLPEMIAFQLQRLSFNKELKAAVKLDSPFKFQKTIYLDRYLEANSAETEVRRARTAALNTEKQLLIDKLDKLLRYKGQDVGIHTHLLRTIEFLKEKQQSVNENGTEGDLLFAFSKQLQDYYKEILIEINRLQEAIEVLQRTIDTTYDDLREYEYRLYGALVHDGSAGSGHYWAYLQSEEQANDKQNNKWYKFNDTNVTIVDEDEVWRESRGGEVKNTSAYCLLYVRSPSTYSTLQVAKLAAEAKEIEKRNERARKGKEIDDDDELTRMSALQCLVEKDNEAFAEEIKQWDRANWLKQQENIAVNEFRLQFEDHLGETLRDTEKENEFIDYKLKTFHHYLWSIDSQDLAMFEIADALYVIKFKKHIQDDLNNPFVSKLQMALPHVSIVSLSTTQRVQRSTLHKEFRSYMTISQYFISALEIWQSDSEYAALPYFLIAYQKEKKHLSYRTSRKEEILVFLSVCLLNLSNTLKKKVLEHPTPGEYSLNIAFQLAVVACLYIKPDLPHVFTFLREEWTMMYEQNKTKPIASDLEKTAMTYNHYGYELKVQKPQLPVANLSLFDRYRMAKKSLPERFVNFEKLYLFVKRKHFGM